MDHRKTLINIFLHPSKAIDTLDHRILLEKLKCYGITWTAHQLMESYITNRNQYVEIDSDICCGWQIPGLQWLCSRKPKLKDAKGSEDIQDKDNHAKGSEDIQDKDNQTQYKYCWSKSVLRLRNKDVYWIFSKYKYKWLLLYNCIKFKCIFDQVKPDLNEYD